MKKFALLLWFFAGLNCFSQNSNSCTSIVEFPDETAIPPKTEAVFMQYIAKTLGPVIGSCQTPDGELLTSIYIDLTIDLYGHVTAVDFLRSKASARCKDYISIELLKMSGWTPAKKDGKKVCSKYHLPINCLNYR